MTPPERQHATRLGDGRRFGWSEWGPPGGRAVLFCTGAGMSGSLGFATDSLTSLDARLVAIDRPGLGRSDPHEGRTFASWAEDIRAVLRGERKPVAVGFSQGAPFALGLAAAGVVDAVAVVSGQDELAHPQVLPLVSEPVATMVADITHDARAFAAAFAPLASADTIWQLVMQTSGPRDREYYGEPGFATAYRASLDEGFTQGANGYLTDLILSFQRWPFALEAIAAPVHLWYGRLDTSPVHSPDFGATLRGRLPNASLTVDPAEGSSILWTRGAAILRQLLAARGNP